VIGSDLEGADLESRVASPAFTSCCLMIDATGGQHG